MARSPELDEKLEASGLDLIDYHDRNGRYRIRLLPGDVVRNSALLAEMLKAAIDEANA